MISGALAVSSTQKSDFMWIAVQWGRGMMEKYPDTGDNLNASLNSYTTVFTCRLLMKSNHATCLESKTWLVSFWPKRILGYLSGILIYYYLLALGQLAWGFNYKIFLPSTISLKLFNSFFFFPLQGNRAAPTLWEKCSYVTWDVHCSQCWIA